MAVVPSFRRTHPLAFLFLLVPLFASAQIRAEIVAQGFVGPLGIVADPAQPDTLYIVEQRGLIRVVVDGVTQATPFLDLMLEVTNEGEQGLLGMAIAPDDQRVFVCWSKRRTPDDGIGDTVISRFRRSSSNRLSVDPASRFDLVWPGGLAVIPQATSVHKGGHLQFGPDGFLYIGLGDGGFGPDPVINAQNPMLPYGKMLRIDVNVPDGDPRGYRVPPDNPFVDGEPVSGLGEIWSVGLRNPWRWSFDDYGVDATRALIIGDVGDGAREEIDYEPAGRGGRNYGWYLREGTIATPGVQPSATPSYLPLTDPIADYPREVGQAVTGGYVYRGTALHPRFRGRYFVADFFGGIYSLGLTLDANGEAVATDVLEHTQELGAPTLIATFGRGRDGELYFSSFIGGRVFKIVPETTDLPSAPESFTSSVDGNVVALQWRPPASGAVDGYQLEVGSKSGIADLLLWPEVGTSVVAPNVPDGLYFVRVRAFNEFGVGPASAERTIQVGCGGDLPTPTGLGAVVAPGGVVSLSWSPVDGAAMYVIEAGSRASWSDLAIIPLVGIGVNGAVPPGTYFVRVRAVTACGLTPPSNEIVVDVPRSAPYREHVQH